MTNRQEIIIYNSHDGQANVALMAHDGSTWLNQNQMAELFATSRQTVSYHIANILKEGELSADSVIRQYRTTAPNGKSCNVAFYSLEMIIAVAYRIKGVRGTQFRRWATRHLSEYLIKGFTLDSERLKNPNGRPDYYDELLARIRDIRASEKRFYQKFKELFALSSDFRPNDKSAQICFETIQDKLFYAVTNQTAAGIISSRAKAGKPNMGLTSWQGSRVRYCDIVIARNYLLENETDTFNRLVTIFLEHAELRVKGHQDLTMDYWKNHVDRILKLLDMNILQGTGSITVQESNQIATEQYELFDAQRKKQEAAGADADDLKLLEGFEKQYKQKKTSRITART